MEKYTELTSVDDYSFLFSNIPGAFILLKQGKEKTILFANSPALKLLGFSSLNELSCKSFLALVHPEDLSYTVQKLNSEEKICIRLLCKDSKYRFFDSCFKSVGDKFYSLLINDDNYDHDPLTGLMRKDYFIRKREDFVRANLEKGNKISFLDFQIKNLKSLDTFKRRELVKKLSDELIKIFHFDALAYSDDGFVAFSVEDDKLADHLDDVIIKFNHIDGSRYLSLIIGVYEVKGEPLPMALCLSRANSESERHLENFRSGYYFLDEKCLKMDITRDYIINNLDKAIEEGWIVPYCQPIIRTLSSKICGVEALARWHDPVHGLITPDLFVPVIEEAKLSYRLDLCILRQIAQILKRRLDSKLGVCPISVNISVSDFLFCDLVSLIVSILDDYSLPRYLINIEFTENAVIGDKERVVEAIKEFHDAGIKVWMDDFGSGYSSLNVLKDFNFDAIKIDMAFLKDLDEKSKTIVRMAVSMAKKLKIHTLAEGVESKEQFDFLKMIGCEMLQGYYFGKPLNEENAILNIRKRFIKYEDHEEASFQNRVGLVDISNESVATALYLYDGNSFSLVFMNDYYRSISAYDELNAEEFINREMNSHDSINGKKFRSLADKAAESQVTERMLFVSRDRIFRFSFKFIASSRKGNMLLSYLDDKEFSETREYIQLDNTVRNIISAFDCIHMIDTEKNIRSVIVSDVAYERAGDVMKSDTAFYKNYADRFIHIDDLARFMKFTSKGYIKSMFALNKRGSYSDVFRFRKEDGSYEWKEFLAIASPGSGSKKIIVCIRPASIEDQEDREQAALRISGYSEFMKAPVSDMYANLWRSLMQASDIKFFWKDKDRRFLGVSKSFLAYYGYNSLDVIIGKRDEDMKMNVDDEIFIQKEKEVLEKGRIVTTRGLNIVDGIIRPIFATKMPLYKGNEICGLIGYFIDVSEDYDRANRIVNESIVDPETGLATARGILITLTDLEDNYLYNHVDFTLVVVKVKGMDSVRDQYGNDLGRKLQSLIVSRLKLIYGTEATVGRFPDSLAICFKRIKDEELENINARAMVEIESIRNLNDSSFTLHPFLGCMNRSEVESVQELIISVGSNLSARNYRKKKDVAVPDAYFDIPLPFIVVRPVIENGSIVDGKYLYVNKKFCDFSGVSSNMIIGSSYEKLGIAKSPLWKKAIEKALRGEYVHDRFYLIGTGLWIEFTISKMTNSDCLIIMITKFE
ncbi:MAG: EAL domain-containing protein [Sphaerochaetaceae bacterium]|nr:EAL domain-containing protein [Sphaerochaetaceae bacterium]